MVELAGDITRWNIRIVRPSILPDRRDNIGNILTSDMESEALVLSYDMTVLEIKLINRQIERERPKGCLAVWLPIFILKKENIFPIG